MTRFINFSKDHKLTASLSLLLGLVGIVAALVKASDAFDYFIARSQAVQEMKSDFRISKSVQDQINKNMTDKIDDVKEDTRAIREALGVAEPRHRRTQ